MTKPIKMSKFAEAVLKDRYLQKGEALADRFKYIAQHFCLYGEIDPETRDLREFTNRMLGYMEKLWFVPSTPILSKGEQTNTGLPISCYLNEVNDSLEDILYIWSESAWLGALGGGIGTNWSRLRSAGQPISRRGVSSGIIPFMKVSDSTTLAVSQGSLRRGASACYLHISHPEIEEFLEIRTTSGDFNRKSLNIHHGVVIPDTFMKAVIDDADWYLIDPKHSEIKKKLSARGLYARLLEVRLSTGEPYIIYEGNINKVLPEHHDKLGLKVSQSNLCSEIMLPTGEDDIGINRTAVCCLGSVNLELFDDWKENSQFIGDCLRFLRKVLTCFITKTKGKSMYWFRNARYSAMLESSIGLGAMGLHSYFQKNMIPFASKAAKKINLEMFSLIHNHAEKYNRVDLSRAEVLFWIKALRFGKGEERFKYMDREIDGRVSFKNNHIRFGKIPIWDRAFCWDHLRQIANSHEFKSGQQETFTLKRCSYMLAIAPTANISIVGNGCSPCIEPVSSNSFTHKTLTGSFHIRNKYLEKLLKKYEESGVDVSNVWDQIIKDGGSVRNIKFLSCREKAVFLTAYEIDQDAIISMAGDRSPFIDQGQSINLFLKSDISKQKLLELHIDAWNAGVKSLYYMRSQSIQRSGFSGGVEADNTLERDKMYAHSVNRNDGESCEVCQ